ncbi:hypothetical protein NBRC111894_979 [Sporolactobacillus inulinus]|uniref:Uncharacterized protein n=1 Tax=Sporolactobacillus inulinus TaxID=2078 RepID=A0A4Y1Z8V4_9BACL|nr:hypothetical protein NBRC111894_979 [Sporolactobacillus inulinus]
MLTGAAVENFIRRMSHSPLKGYLHFLSTPAPFSPVEAR